MRRAIQVSVVKKSALAPGETPVETMLTPEQVNAIAKEQIQNIAMTVGAVLLVKKGADTLSELILIAGRKYI